MTVKLRVVWYDNNTYNWIYHHDWNKYCLSLRPQARSPYNEDLKVYNAKYIDDGKFNDSFLHFESSEDLCAF